jgi:hypothetical protein
MEITKTRRRLPFLKMLWNFSQTPGEAPRLHVLVGGPDAAVRDAFHGCYLNLGLALFGNSS